MNQFTIRYCFTMPDRSKEEFLLPIDTDTLELAGNLPETLPSWTALEFHRCPNCVLTVETHAHCPLAAHIVNIVKGFETLVSHDEVCMDVTTADRFISQTTSVQKGLSSLIGLVIATCGCPHTAFFRPMARFHLPLANDIETTYRAASMYLLAQYFLKNAGYEPDFELTGLVKIYDNMQIINTNIARRLKAAVQTDSSVNAIIRLHAFSMSLPMAIGQSLEKIRYLFETYFRNAV